jgi:hypothetical protein
MSFVAQAARARALFKAGLRSVQAIAEATLPEIVKALYGNISWAGPGTNQSDMLCLTSVLGVLHRVIALETYVRFWTVFVC